MLTHKRREQIRSLLSNQEQLDIQEISQVFNVSVATARRDLDALAKQGKIQRIHGGALNLYKAPPELPSLQRGSEQSAEKERIAKTIVQLVRDGETIFLGGGTTVEKVAELLPPNLNLTVLTNSLLVANALAHRKEINLIILGGTFRHSEFSMYGHLVEIALKEVYADKVIFGIYAIHPENGLTNDFLPEVSTDRAILKIGREVIIAADHTKFMRVSTALVCPLSWVHKIVTGSETSPEIMAKFRERDIDVIAA
jgi:DeoR/GlpR family transcriptional regulator of sugar metabolism